MELTDRSDAFTRGWTGRGIRPPTGSVARRCDLANDEQRSVEAVDQVERWLRVVDDPWLHVRRDAVLGELARIQRRFEDAVAHLSRAAETSRRLGFQQTEAYQVASLGRA